MWLDTAYNQLIKKRCVYSYIYISHIYFSSFNNETKVSVSFLLQSFILQ